METMLIILILLLPLMCFNYLLSMYNIDREYEARMRVNELRFRRTMSKTKVKVVDQAPRKLPIRL